MIDAKSFSFLRTEAIAYIKVRSVHGLRKSEPSELERQILSQSHVPDLVPAKFISCMDIIIQKIPCVKLGKSITCVEIRPSLPNKNGPKHHDRNC